MAVTDPDHAQADRSAAIARFLTLLAEVFGVDELTPTDHFLDLGGDSLDAVIVMDRVDLEFGVRPELDLFFESENVTVLAERWWELAAEARQAALAPAGDAAAD
jgi:acyl carrier protein